jgi:hypothetical protein
MATAGNHKVIIEQGADYSIEVQVSENGITNKDLNGFTPTMAIKYATTDGSVVNVGVYTGTLIPDIKTEETDPDTYLNGYFKVVIDKEITATLAVYPNGMPVGADPFATTYEYFYNIDLNNDSSDDLRVLRGKLAVRA